jgi:polyisoprenoid-binding protein YceI
MTRTKWLIDPTHSTLAFKVKHLMITNVSGSFKRFNAEVEYHERCYKACKIKC